MPIYDLPTAKQRVSAYATPKYGRGPTEDEFARIGSAIGYGGGDITDEMLNQAYGEVDRIASSYGATSPQPQAPLPAPDLDLEAAKQQVTGYATPRYGRGPTEQEFATIGQNVGYQGGSVTQDMLQRAFGEVDQLARAQGAPNAPAAPAAPAQTAISPPAGVNIPPNLQATVGNLFASPPTSPVQSVYQDSLLSLIQNAQRPPSLTDPTLQPASDVYRASQQRATERARSALAERAAATGTLGAGGFDAGVQQLYNEEGRNIAEYNANLVLGEMQARRQQLMQGLALAQATGNAEAARQLQTQLALLQESMGESQFGRELGFREKALGQQGTLGRGELALRLLALLTGNAYNYDVLGSNNAFRLSDSNQRALELLLGGL
jgi:hypothetical protein